MYKKKCKVCGAAFQSQWNRRTCSAECEKNARRLTALPAVEMQCAVCGKTVLCQGPSGRGYVRKGRAYCSAECSKSYSAMVSSRTMARTNRKYASARMLANNPMMRPEVRAKVSAILRTAGWKPIKRCGNGELTEPQKLLACALGWEMELAVRTGMGRGSGYPSVYKVDVGNAELKIAVEVDGASHGVLSRRGEDLKKDHFLESIGWKVLRLKNEYVTKDLAGCVQAVLSLI